LDFLLEGPGGLCYLETKSVTLVADGVGLFPDAPTARGVKHMKSLCQAVAAGHRAAAVFVVQRDDAYAFATHDAADPEFGAALRQALAAGVEAFAYGCHVTERSIGLSRELPMKL
jgi:sugar fermentation stimulation protein A